MVHILLLHILCLRTGIGMPVFMPDPWFIIIYLRSTIPEYDSNHGFTLLTITRGAPLTLESASTVHYRTGLLVTPEPSKCSKIHAFVSFSP